MSAVLNYQQVYIRPRRAFVVSFRVQCALIALLISFVSTKVYVQSEITQLGYRIGTERIRSRELEGTVRELQLARSVLLRPRTLQAEARARVGLVALLPTQARRIVPRDSMTPRTSSLSSSRNLSLNQSRDGALGR